MFSPWMMYLYGMAASSATILGLAAFLVVRRIRLMSVHWTPREAKIVNLDIFHFRGDNKLEAKIHSQLPDRFRKPYSITCEYQYTVDGTRYEGNTITPTDYLGAMHWPNYNSKLVADLKLANNANKSLPIIVDPINPRRSMISRVVQWKSFVLTMLFSLVATIYVLWLAANETNTPFILAAMLISATLTAILYSNHQRKLERSGRFLAKIVG